MLRIRTDDRAKTLLQPVDDVLQRALRMLPGGPVLEVTVGPVDGFYRLSDAGVVLAERLEGPGVHHPDEPMEAAPLDRWRRALCSVLEAASLRELARRSGATPDLADWRWVGAALYAADVVAPDASLALPDIARGLATGDLGATPRGGVLAYLAWRQSGTDPLQQATYLLEGGVVSAQEWLKLVGWLLDPSGPARRLPLPVVPPAPTDIPATMPPWSWRPVAVPAHARGGRIEVEGAGAVAQPWAVADAPHHSIAGATEGGCRLLPGSGGPTGRWDVASADAFGQIVGARGITFDFRAGGAVELVLADAFVGPLAAVAMAEEVGTSGVTMGRWKVAGPQRLAFQGLQAASMTLHGRRQGGFAMPAGGFGLATWLQALEEGPWAWKQMPERLVLRGTMRGGAVEVRLRPA